MGEGTVFELQTTILCKRRKSQPWEATRQTCCAASTEKKKNTSWNIRTVVKGSAATCSASSTSAGDVAAEEVSSQMLQKGAFVNKGPSVTKKVDSGSTSQFKRNLNQY